MPKTKLFKWVDLAIVKRAVFDDSSALESGLFRIASCNDWDEYLSPEKPATVLLEFPDNASYTMFLLRWS